jgi:DUF3102 family protein
VTGKRARAGRRTADTNIPEERMHSTDIALSNSLADLAARIRAEHEAASTALTDGFQHAMTAGQLLVEAKRQVAHGDWLTWLESSCDLSPRTAQAYMRVARSFNHLGSNAQRVAHLSFRDTLKLLAKTSSQATRLPTDTLTSTLAEIENGDDTLGEAVIKAEGALRRQYYPLENPVPLLPAPGRKARVARNPTERLWMLAIGPREASPRSSYLFQKQENRARLQPIYSRQIGC